MNMKKLHLIKTQVFGSQKNMAEGLGISKAKMSYIFSGIQDMPQDAIERLILNYKINAHWLFSPDENYKIEYITDYVAKAEVAELKEKLFILMEENAEYRRLENSRLKNNPTVSDTQQLSEC
jgi:transcriptional regulator with XRE-family HTH domain